MRVGAQGGEQEAGEKEAMTSGEGRLETVNATACVVPEMRVALIGMETEAPRVTPWSPLLLLLREKVKAGAPLPIS